MGTWGPGIYSNDTVMDLRCDCNEIFAFYGVEEGNKVLFREYKEIVERNYVDDDTASFWYALADWQWKHGMLTEQVKKKALELLKEYAGLDEWIEAGNEKNTKKRKANLDALKEQLQKEQMPYKRPRVTLARPKHNPGDIVVFQYTDIREKWWGRPDFYAPFYFASPVIAKSPLVDDIKKTTSMTFMGNGWLFCAWVPKNICIMSGSCRASMTSTAFMLGTIICPTHSRISKLCKKPGSFRFFIAKATIQE